MLFCSEQVLKPTRGLLSAPRMYEFIKTGHMTLAAISLASFVFRAGLHSVQHPWCRSLVIKTVPHINDSLLLAAAIWLAWSLGVHPGNSPWLLAKVLGLALYIFAANRVIKGRGSVAGRLLYFSLALLSFAYIAAVAITKQVIPMQLTGL